MNILLTTLYFIIVLTIVVFIHELGHFLVAKSFGVKIVEFSIGMGRKLFGFKDKDGCDWSVRLLPVGGYVQMYGDDNASSFNAYKENPTEDELKYSLQYKHPLKKIAVAFAGPFMNFVLAFVLFFATLVFQGKPVAEPIIYKVSKDSYAEKSGIRAGDKIIAINGKKIVNFNDIVLNLQGNKNKKNKIELIRKGKTIYVNAQYKKNELFGIQGNKIKYDKIPVSSSIKESFNMVYDLSVKTGKAFWNMFAHQTGFKNIGGPIGIAKESAKAGELGFWTFVYFIALISVALGATNLIPIPVLDGGQMVISFFEFITRRRISNFVYKILAYIGLGFVIALMGLGFVNDLFINR